MNTNKFLTGGVVAGILYFGLGYLVWGILLKDFMAANAGSAGNVMKADADLVWWALIAGNLFSGFALSYVLNKAGSLSAGAGAVTGAVFSLLVSAGFDFTMLGVSNLMTTTGVLGDICASTVVGAVIGGITGIVLGMGKKAA
jgi:hypothetical protein